MSHANAALTPKARLRVARLVVDQGVPIPEVAARFQCSYPTVKRWASRYAAGESMQDRSSRPHTMPGKTCPATTKRIVSLRLRKRLGPVQLAAHVGVAPSTVHRVLTRCGLIGWTFLSAVLIPVRDPWHKNNNALSILFTFFTRCFYRNRH